MSKQPSRSSNIIKRIFSPTPVEQLEDMERGLKIADEQEGKCPTCRFYVPADSPGFVDDRGYCEKKRKEFFDIMVWNEDPECNAWEDDGQRDVLRIEIKRLKDIVTKECEA